MFIGATEMKHGQTFSACARSAEKIRRTGMNDSRLFQEIQCSLQSKQWTEAFRSVL